MHDSGERPLALVTGASRGIGAAVAHALARSHDLLWGGRDEIALQEVATALPGSRPWPAELTDPVALTEATAGIERLDVLVHAAGVGLLGTVAGDLCGDVAPAVRGQRRRGRGADPAVAARAGAARGCIVLLNSGLGLAARAESCPYAASKFALRAFADALRAEETGNGVRVTSVHPGRVATDMQRHIVEHEGGDYLPQNYLSPESVADAVAFAVSAPADTALTEVVLWPAAR